MTIQRVTYDYFEVDAENDRDRIEKVKAGIFNSHREGAVVFSVTANSGQPGRKDRDPSTGSPKDWPPWAKALKLLAKPEDKGIGDVVARTIGTENSAAFKAWYKTIFGKDCDCDGRHAEWNRKYPIGK